MEFSQFCACGPSGYAALKQKVDACARLGRSYEFSSCTLPPGCAPGQAQVGFWRRTICSISGPPWPTGDRTPA